MGRQKNKQNTINSKERGNFALFNRKMHTKVSKALVIVMLMSLLLPTLAFALSFDNVTFEQDGNVSGTVTSDTYLEGTVTVDIYGILDGDEVYLGTVTSDTYDYSVTDDVYTYEFDYSVVDDVYASIILKSNGEESIEFTREGSAGGEEPGDGEPGDGEPGSEDTIAPTWDEDAKLTASDVTKTSLRLNWPAATDASETVTYSVYKGDDDAITVTEATYNFTGLRSGTTYSFKVYAEDAAGNVVGPLVDSFKTKNNSNSDGGSPSSPSDQVEADPQGNVTAEQLSGAFNNEGKATVKVKDVANLPASALVEAAKTEGAVLTIEGENGSYDLPLAALKFDELAAQLGVDVADLTIKVEIKKVEGETAATISTAVTALGATSLIDPIDFNVVVEGKDGQSVAINDFGQTYVSRSVVVDKAIDSSKATGVLYNPATGEFSFVPATFTTDAEGNTIVTLKRNGNSIYTVIENNKSFSDIEGHWAQEDIELLANKLIVSGRTADEFDAQGNITRAEFTALLVRSLGLSLVDGNADFTDVDADDWFAAEVATAAQAGIISGYEDGTFRPNAKITREELASLVIRGLTFAGANKELTSEEQAAQLSKFNDADSIVAWADADVAAAVEAGIVLGRTEDTFVPKATATRAEAVAMIQRFLVKAGFINE